MIFTKDFESDIRLIKNNIDLGVNFAFSKYADGEHQIMLNRPIRNCDNWFFNPQEDDKFQKMLVGSLKFKSEGYYIGISCPCCDVNGFNWYNSEKGSDESNTTFANIFVNGNYEYFKNNLLPSFNKFKKIVLIANKDSNLEKLNEVLNITDFYGIGPEAFKTDLHLIEDLKSLITNNDLKNSLFLFCAGPLGNVLSHQLWEHNKNNTYIDIGSTLNVWTEKNIRDYQTSNGVYSNKICNF